MSYTKFKKRPRRYSISFCIQLGNGATDTYFTSIELGFSEKFTIKEVEKYLASELGITGDDRVVVLNLVQLPIV